MLPPLHIVYCILEIDWLLALNLNNRMDPVDPERLTCTTPTELSVQRVPMKASPTVAPSKSIPLKDKGRPDYKYCYNILVVHTHPSSSLFQFQTNYWRLQEMPGWVPVINASKDVIWAFSDLAIKFFSVSQKHDVGL